MKKEKSVNNQKTEEPLKKHSKIGIAALVISLMNIFFEIFVFAFLNFFPIKEGESFVFVVQLLIDFALLAVIYFPALGLLLGIIALFGKNKRKLFPVLAITLSIISTPYISILTRFNT